MLFTYMLKKDFQHHLRWIIKDEIVILFKVLEGVLITYHSPYENWTSSMKVHLK